MSSLGLEILERLESLIFFFFFYVLLILLFTLDLYPFPSSSMPVLLSF